MKGVVADRLEFDASPKSCFSVLAASLRQAPLKTRLTRLPDKCRRAMFGRNPLVR
jgi:hypothetical protein